MIPKTQSVIFVRPDELANAIERRLTWALPFGWRLGTHIADPPGSCFWQAFRPDIIHNQTHTIHAETLALGEVVDGKHWPVGLPELWSTQTACPNQS